LRYVFIAKWGLQMNLMTKTEDLFSLTLDHSEATYLDREKLLERQRRVQAAFDPKGLADLKTMVDAYIAGTRDLSAMEFYLEFEQACALVLFHTLPRRGERNKHANGLQQTYGDHIRLMMLGFDKFDESDMDWVMTRRWMDPISIERPELEESVQRYLDLKFSRSEKVAVWITSALHDYGKIFRRGYGLDAEDAAPLCEDLVEALAPDGMSELIHYGIRNHDLIEYTISGDTPASFITAPLMDVPESVRDRAMPMLGIIQHIGAASLGEGRLSGAKLEIYNACCDGSIVADGSIAARLGRMLYGPRAVPDAQATAKAQAQLDAMDAGVRADLEALLEDTVLLGWEPIYDMVEETETDEAASVARQIKALEITHQLWSDAGKPEHVVYARPHLLVKAAGADGDTSRAGNEDTMADLLNGAKALILR
jgi:hypothetical protein